VNSFYRYLFHGERVVDPIRLRIGKDCLISPPNFYLFPSYKGLFVLSEVFLDLGKRGYFISFGTGLDSFGLSGVGDVDRIVIGCSSHSVNIPVGFIELSLSPYLYLNFSKDMRHLGQSFGLVSDVWVGSNVSLFSRFGYSSNDMIEQIIKYKEEGYDIFCGIKLKL